jgi:ABC-type transport system involved in multi-copper enzyme maturation permease subunit
VIDSRKMYKQIQTAITIHKRDLRIALFSPALYIVTTVSILVGIVIIRNYLSYIESNGLYPMPDLFSFPFRWVIIVTGVYLAFSAVVAIARERESGTMELLFYGPVDNVSYVVGKYSAQFTLYCLLIVLYLICFLILSNIAGVHIPESFFMMMLLSLFTGAYLISVGIFVSTISKSVRSATLAFLTLIASALFIQTSQALLSSIAPESDYYNPVLLLQQLLAWIQTLLSWLSPFSYLNYGVDEMLRGNMAAFLRVIGLATVFSLVFIVSSIIGLKIRGVRQ